MTDGETVYIPHGWRIVYAYQSKQGVFSVRIRRDDREWQVFRKGPTLREAIAAAVERIGEIEQ